MITKIIENLKKFKPLSIFLYGSMALGSPNSKSDYEIGVIFNKKEYVSRVKLKESLPDKNLSIFPFRLEELQSYSIDTPFQKKIYINSMINGNAKTIYGEKIIENLTPPSLSVQDFLMEAYFNLGYATAAVQVFKKGDANLANELWYKSLFYATRDLIYAKTDELVCGYNNIYEKSKSLNLPEEYTILLDTANKVRNEKLMSIDPAFYFKNISYINKYVIPTLENNL